MKPGIRHQALGTNKRVKLVAFALCAMLFLTYSSAEAQQPKIFRIGFLAVSPSSALTDRIEAFRHGLRERGYEERKNIVIEYRYGSRRG
jgi:hypothetical protein